MIELVLPAADRALLTIDELRAAIGGASMSDEDLQSLGLRVADMIALECNVAPAGIRPPTLIEETLRQRIDRPSLVSLCLARRFVGAIVSVTEAGVLVPLDGIDLDAAAGIVERRWDGCAGSWGRPVVVEYKAGFPKDAVPSSLKEAAILAVREMVSAAGRDPLLRAEQVDDVHRLEWQVGGSARDTMSALPSMAVAVLAPFTTVHIT